MHTGPNPSCPPRTNSLAGHEYTPTPPQPTPSRPVRAPAAPWARRRQRSPRPQPVAARRQAARARWAREWVAVGVGVSRHLARVTSGSVLVEVMGWAGYEGASPRGSSSHSSGCLGLAPRGFLDAVHSTLSTAHSPFPPCPYPRPLVPPRPAPLCVAATGRPGPAGHCVRAAGGRVPAPGGRTGGGGRGRGVAEAQEEWLEVAGERGCD